MKKTTLTILAMIFVASGLFAQSKSATPSAAPSATIHNPVEANQKALVNPAEKAKGWADKISTNTKLTEDQHSKVYDVLLQYYTDRREIAKANAGGSEDAEKGAKIEALKNTRDTKIKAILTPEQYQVYKASQNK